MASSSNNNNNAVPVVGREGQVVPYVEPPVAVTSGILRVGIELEFQLCVTTKTPELKQLFENLVNARRNGREPHWILAQWVEQRYNVWRKDKPKAYEMILDFWNHPVDAKDKDTGYKKWSVTRDGSIKDVPEYPAYGLEFVSPIMYVGLSDEWFEPVRQTIMDFYSFLTEYCQLELGPDDNCGTHVHVSPQQWTRTRIERLAFASFFFEEPTRALLPSIRQTCQFAKEYRSPYVIGKFNLPNIILPSERTDWPYTPWVDTSNVTESDVIRSLRNIKDQNLSTKDLLEIFNPRKLKESIFHTRVGSDEFDRYFGWNFNNLVFDKLGVPQTIKAPKGSVEFRRGPRCNKPRDALTWIEFVVAFTLAACYHGDVDELKKYGTKSFKDANPENPIRSGATVASLRDFLNAPKAARAPTDLAYANQPGWTSPDTHLKRILTEKIELEAGHGIWGTQEPTDEQIAEMRHWNEWVTKPLDAHLAAFEFLFPADPEPPTHPGQT